MFDDINDENVLLYAVKCYDSPNCVMSEFSEDYNRIQLIKKMFTRYLNSGELNARLILNHIVVVYNVFGIEGASRLLFYHMREEHYSLLKPFLVLLSIMPAEFIIRGNLILSSDIPLDKEIVKCLRNLDK
jgi:hypothetical protein